MIKRGTYWDDLEIRLEREVHVGEGLSLHSLRGIDHEKSTLARHEGAGDLRGVGDY